jgi:hypothetical protein
MSLWLGPVYGGFNPSTSRMQRDSEPPDGIAVYPVDYRCGHRTGKLRPSGNFDVRESLEVRRLGT